MNLFQKVISLSAVCLAFMSATAAADEVKNKIYEIKMDSDNYLYTEVTLPSDDNAVTQALKALVRNASMYAEKKGAAKMDWESLKPGWKVLTTIRGDHTRAFAYIAFAELDKLIEPHIKAPETEAVADTTATTDTTDTIVLEIAQPIPTEEPEKVAPAESQAKPEVEKKEEPAQQKKAEKKPSVRSYDSKYKTEVLRRLLQTNTLERAMACLNTFKKEGKVAEFGPVHKLEGNTADYILVIYDRSLNVVAFLSDGEYRINLKSELPEDLANYKGCAAIGVRIN